MNPQIHQFIHKLQAPFLCLAFAGGIGAYAQTTPPVSTEGNSTSLADSVQQLRQQVEELRGAVADMKSQTEQYRRQNDELRKELQAMREDAQKPRRPPVLQLRLRLQRPSLSSGCHLSRKRRR